MYPYTQPEKLFLVESQLWGSLYLLLFFLIWEVRLGSWPGLWKSRGLVVCEGTFCAQQTVIQGQAEDNRDP